MNIALVKRIPGEHFDNLDMLTELLTKRPPDPAGAVRRPLVEMLDPEDSEGEEIDWDMEQELPRPDAAEELTGLARYGFNAAYSGIFRSGLSPPPSSLSPPPPPQLGGRQSRPLGAPRCS